VTFVLIVEYSERFEENRAVSAYLGLVPKKDQSGDSDSQRRISKRRDTMLRRLLVRSALGPFRAFPHSVWLSQPI